MVAYAGLRAVLTGAWGLSNRGGGNANWDADPADPTQVRFVPTDERFRDMLRLMNRMYANGLIDPDAMTQNEVAWGAKAVQSDPATIGFVTNDTLFAYNAEHYYVGAPALTGPYGDQLFTSVGSHVPRPWNYIITRVAPDVALAVEFGDYWMTYDASILFHSGAEGIHWDWDETRTRRVAQAWIDEDPAGRSADQMRSAWTSQPGGSWFGPVWPSVPDLERNYVAAREGLRPYMPHIVWPTFSLTQEEVGITVAEGTDITTHFRESVVGFVHGRLCLNNDWDAYVARYNAMGLARLRGVYQGAYDRFLATGGLAN
jgi:putative aldouronate transport system substrate-binding protein